MSETGEFQDPSDYDQQCDADLVQAQQMLEELEGFAGTPTVASVLDPLNDLWMLIDRSLNTAQLLRNVHPDPRFRDLADSCEQKLSSLVTNISLSRRLFEAVSRVDVSCEDAVTQRHVSHVLRDFRRAGVDRDEAARAKIRVLRDELVLLGQEFGKNIREDVRAIQLTSAEELAGLPADYIEAHPVGADGKITITTDYPDMIPFMTYAHEDGRRLELYRKFRKRGVPKNETVLLDILEKRHVLADLLGYESWAEYITEDKMIGSAKAAAEFVDRVAGVSANRADRDYGELLAALRTEQPDAVEVGDWQKSFLEQRLKRDKYEVDSAQVREFFPYDAVKQGVLGITERIFGIRHELVTTPTWHESVEVYDVFDGEERLGRFYLDMHPRADKYKHAAAFPLQSGVANRRVPEAALVCNFPGGDESRGLMEHDQVETFFHEFGHLLHHLLGGRHRWVEVSGFNVEWDFVEAPSQLLEEWAWDAETLRTFAHNDRNEAISEELVAKMRRARDFGKGLWVRHQMFYAALSLRYHQDDPAELDTTHVMQELQQKYSPFRYVEDTYFQYSFAHLDGYSAMYYTYMWSLVIAKDLFSVFQKEGMLNPAPARRYRTSVLEPGGSVDANDMVAAFLGRDVSFDSFARWLNADE